MSILDDAFGRRCVRNWRTCSPTTGFAAGPMHAFKFALIGFRYRRQARERTVVTSHSQTIARIKPCLSFKSLSGSSSLLREQRG